jgi:mRNA interferase MazF
VTRGEVWWALLTPPPTTSRAPHMVLLLSWDAGRGIRDRVTVAPITSRIRGLDAEVYLDEADGMAHACVVNLDIVATILSTTLDRRVTKLGDAKMREVERAIHRALGMRLPCAVR